MDRPTASDLAPTPDELAAMVSKRRIYMRVRDAVNFASSSNESGDGEGESFAVAHAINLLADLLPAGISRKEANKDAVELDGVREVQGQVQDLQEAGPPQEEGPREDDVVPVVQDGDPAPRAVLTMEADQPEDSKHGTNGINPKVGVPPRIFRLYSLKANGEDLQFVDEGTAAELANRNAIGASSVYRIAGKPGEPGRKWRVERITR